MQQEKKFGPALLQVLRRAGKRGLTAHELCDKLRVKRPQREAFYKELAATVKNGKIKEKKGRFAPADGGTTVTARIVSVKGGFGFAAEENGERDIFVPGRALKGALPGDIVQLCKTRGQREGGLPEGEVLRIVEQSNLPFTGVLEQHGNVCEILPDKDFGAPVRVSRAATGGARDGDKVLAYITQRGESHYDHRAAVERVFGSAQSAAACSEAILAASGIVREFPPEVASMAEQLSSTGIDEAELARRLDLRGETIFTIDGADTKDIDDAISLTRTESGWALGVHIADVSHYVREGTPLDADAFERGTSVYFADSVVPMLPTALSNGICSLNPQEDRLAFSALMQLDSGGALVSYRFAKTVIRSCIKGVYSEINAILEGAEDAPREKYTAVLTQLDEMRTLAALLSKRRIGRGGLDLESAESKIVIGVDGTAQGVYARVSGLSEHMIEDFMLTANEAAARVAQEHDLPFVYRIHENPPIEKLEMLCTLLDKLGLGCEALRNGTASCGALSNILEASREKGLSDVVNHQLLRSMAKAKYSPENKGHFGLVLGHYAHFTSPIRRYPDLAIHRILTAYVAGTAAEKLESRYAEFAARASEQSSNRELRAMTAERDCEACYRAEYMRGHLGEVFDGIISGVSARGIFVRLESTVEGFVRLDDLPEGSYDCDGLVELRELTSGACYRVGMTMRVVAAAADVSSGRVDFAPAPTEGQPTIKAE